MAVSSAERRILDRISLEEPWKLVETFSTMPRWRPEDVNKGADVIVSRLKALGVPVEVHEPEIYLSIPLSALVCLLITSAMGGSVNTMLLGGLALAFSRLIDDSVVVLENIFRFMEMGIPPREAAEKGGMEVSLAVLAATSTTSPRNQDLKPGTQHGIMRDAGLTEDDL